MKVIAVFSFCVCCLSVSAQETKPADSLYIVTYTTGSLWDHSKSPGEQSYFKEHSANLNKLRKDGIIKAGARYGEKGIIFIVAASMQAASEIVFSDPSVANKLFNAEVPKMSVFYEGCLEKPKTK